LDFSRRTFFWTSDTGNPLGLLILDVAGLGTSQNWTPLEKGIFLESEFVFKELFLISLVYLLQLVV